MYSRRMCNSRGGFTLVEIIVTLTILAILAGIATVSLTAYVREEKFKTNEAYAQSIYVAAQNALTHYKVSGELDAVATEICDAGTLLTAGMVADAKFTYTGRLYSIMKTSSDPWETSVIGKLLGDYVYDKSILAASVCIELDPFDGVVYSVSYSDSADAFCYGISYSDSRISISDRTYDTRKSLMFGFYCVDALSPAAPGTLGKPVIGKFELVNSETLFLRWSMSDKFRTVMNVLNYTIKIYDAADDSLLLSFTVNNDDASRILARNGDANKITCLMTFHREGNDVSVPLIAYAEDNEMFVILDAVDISSETEIINSMSAVRLELSAGGIYAKIQASGNSYKSSVWKSSGTESALFGKYTENNGIKTVEIKNARHLFNIRYTEEEGGYSYIQTDTAVWGGSDGIISRGKVYTGFMKVTNTSAVFPCIPKLSETSSYTVKNNAGKAEKYSVRGLNLKNDNDESVGLFSENCGTVTGLTLTKLSSEGKAFVGSVCGINKGVLTDISVDGSVKGETDVGGIAGTDAVENSGDCYSNLLCSATVTGNENVGGIVGSAYGATSFSDCVFTGTLSLTPKTGETDDFNNCAGGIIGKNSASSVTDSSSIIHTLEPENLSVNNLYGSAVGGIIGYNSKDGALTSCSTGNESESGYVTGKRYVGGIIGYQETDASGFTLSGNGGLNRSFVLGGTYAGGIVGYIESTPENAANVILSGWNNEGVVTAGVAYGGGITGYNGGTVINCSSRVNTGVLTGEDVMALVLSFGAPGDYIGGLVGYNAGTVTSTSSMNISAVVCGKDYVGGCVGYNAEDAELSNISLSGGYIQGDAYVGGIAGLNLSDKLFTDNTVLSAAPNRITGKLYTGGITGASVMRTADDIETSFVVDNFLGTVTGGDSFTGGAVGYLKLLPADMSDSELESYLSALKVKQGETLNAFYDRITLLNSAYTSGGSFKVSAEAGTVRLASVTGGICVGGIIGYCDHNTVLQIENYTNNTPITATMTVKEDGVDYAHSGGIIGLCGRNILIVNCSNSGSAAVTSHGFYTGGLTEANYGEIRDCVATSIGSARISHIGGIVGLNGESGKLNGCTLNGTVTGKTGVGGLASVNNGEIISGDGSLTGKVSGVDIVGGIAGENNGTVRGIKAENLGVSGSGSHIGGFIGINSGTLTDSEIGQGSSVSGKNNVGGIIGTQSGDDDGSAAVSSCASAANVTGENYTGGLIGRIMSSGDITVSACSSIGNVTAKSGDCGGITCELPSLAILTGCSYSGTINAAKGYCGGIVSVSRGKVENCTVGDSGKTTLVGQLRVGGIAAENNSDISGCSVADTSLSDIRGVSASGLIGGIAALNAKTGKISDCTVDSKVNVISYVNGSSIGGAVGRNNGVVGGTEGSLMNIEAQLSLYTGTVGFVGGISGENSGNISYCGYKGTLTGNSGASYGYGGICGINKSADNQTKATVTNCVTSGSVLAGGQTSDYVNIGGIAGVNSLNDIVEYCSLTDCTVTGDAGYIGGIIGHNYGKVENCLNDDDTTVTVTAKDGGDIGGIIGRNERYGDVDYCSTGENWSVIAEKHQTDNTIAGIIGYNISDSELSYLINRADVTKIAEKSNVVGGIIGRNENQTSSAWKLVGCENYGTIYGMARLGGIVALVKYNGGSFVDCVNSGEVISKKSSSESGLCGGILGYGYSLNPNETVNITGCRNEGDISGVSNIGGIMGSVGGSSINVNIKITDCVNTGEISGTSNLAGIYGNNSGNSKAAQLTRCRDYGRSSNAAAYSGMSNSKVKIVNCFSVASSSSHPLMTSASTSDNNISSYYFGRIATGGGTIETDPYIFNMVTEGSTSSNNAASGLVDGSLLTRWDASASSNLNGGNNNIRLELAFSEPVELSHVFMVWYKENRTYQFRIMYRENGGEYQYLKDVDDNIAVFSGTGVADSALTAPGATLASVAESYDLSAYGLTDVTGIKIEVFNASNQKWVSMWELWFDNILSKSPISETDPSNTAVDPSYELKLSKVEDGSYTASAGVVEITDLPVNPNAYTTTGLWQYSSSEIYEQIDPLLLIYYSKSVYTDNPSMPTELTVSDVGGNYEIKWAFDPTVTSYEVTLSADTLSGAYTYTENVFNSSSLIWGPDSPALSGVNISVSVIAHGTDPDVSSPAATTSFIALEPLPTPNVRAELVNTVDEVCIRYALLNKEDYEKLNCNVYARIDNGNYVSINMSTGYSVNTTMRNSTYSSSLFTAYATSNDNTRGRSIVVNTQTQAAKASTLRTSNLFSAVFNGFSGITADSLSYSLTLNQVGKEVYCRSEILVEDATFGYISASYSVGRVTALGTGVPVSLLIPTEIASSLEDNTSVIVRAYAQSSQNELLCFGYEIASGLTVSDILSDYSYAVESCSYAEDGSPRITLNPGYVVGYIGTSTTSGVTQHIYSLYFNEVLKDDDFYAILIKTPSGGVILPPEAPVPVIEDIEVDNTGITLSWDKALTDPSAMYAVTLTGYAKDTDGNVTDETVLFTSASYASKTLTVNSSAWSWSNVKLTVERLGTQNTNGITLIRSSVAEAEFEVKISLTQITAPTVSLYNGDKNNLVYSIVWDPVEHTDTEYPYVMGYTVYAVSEADPSRQLSVYVPDADSDSVILDLETDNVFISGENVLISVTADALRNDDGEYLTDYKDSDTGVPYILILPSRMPTPDINAMTLNKSFDLESPVSVSSFENDGFILSMTSSSLLDGKYVLEAMLYPEHIDDISEYDTEANPPVKKWDATVMTGSIQQSVFALTGLDADMAGYRLYIRIRTVADNYVSSLWTEYAEFRLAAIQPDAVDITGSSVIISHIPVNKLVPSDNSGYTDYEDLTHDSVTFRSVRYGRSYTLTFNNYYGESVSVLIRLNSDLNAIESLKVNGNSVLDINGVYTLYDKAICLDGGEYIYSYRSACTLSAEYVQDSLSFTVVLPDVINPYRDAEGFLERLLFTSSLEVTSLPAETQADRVAPSVTSSYTASHDGEACVNYREKLSMPTDLAVTENKERDDDYSYDVHWSYTPIRSDAVPESFSIKVTDSLLYPVRVYTATATGTSGNIQIPLDVFNKGDTVYIFVIAEPSSGSAYASSLQGVYYRLELPAVKLSSPTGLTVTENTDANDDWGYNLSWSYAPSHPVLVAESFCITVADSLVSPSRVYTVTVNSLSTTVLIPTDAFNAGDTVYVSVVASPAASSSFEPSKPSEYCQLILPELPEPEPEG